MKVLMQTRAGNIKIKPGGDLIQAEKTKEYLKKIGIKTDISSDDNINLDKYNLVHIFNTIDAQDCYRFLKNAQEQKKPIAFSTIYWNMNEFAIGTSTGKLDKIRRLFGKRVANAVLNIKNKFSLDRKLRRFVLGNSDILLPNSQSEKEVLIKDFNLSPQKLFKIVPNAVDDRFLQDIEIKENDFIKKYGISDFILCVGRIENRKNQVKLLEALKNISVPIVFVGQPKDIQPDYYRKCQKLAKKCFKVIFVGSISHEQLPSVYAAAKVHVLPSWYETPGLTSLEAAACGCNIVTTDRGGTKEYFKDMAWYCDPNNINSIKKAVQKALKAPKTDKLKKHIKDNFTWSKAAEATLKAYKIISN